MKKYRCPKCGEYYEGEASVCPHCGAAMKYRNTITVEEEIKIDTASSNPKFNFHGEGVVYHPDSIFDSEQYENINNETSEEAKEAKEKAAMKAPEHYEKMIMEEGNSYFDGHTVQRFGWNLLEFLLTICTAFLAFPWVMCMKYRWETKHTVINGRRLCFDGTGGQLFGRFLLRLVLTILTVGIYGISLRTSLKAWKVKHTHFLTNSGEKI